MRGGPLAALVLVLAGCGTEGPDVATTQATAPTAPPAAQQPTIAATQPAKAPAPSGKAIPPIPTRTEPASPQDPELFFLFPDEDAARAAAADLKRHGYRVRSAPPEHDIPNWSVIAEGSPAIPLKAAEEKFSAWAEARGGRYDGSEVGVGP
jgi:hypothetical protein